MQRNLIITILALTASLIGRCVADELREVDEMLFDLSSDLKFGLAEYHCQIEGKIGTSPDSPNWFEGEIRSDHTHSEKWHTSTTTWSLYDLSNEQDMSKPHSVALRSCSSREVVYENVAYRPRPNFESTAETWSPVSENLKDYSCPNLCPLSWLTPLQADFGLRRKHQIGAFIYRLENLRCIRATKSDNGKIDAIVITLPSTGDGKYLAFKHIILSKELPVSIVDYSFQSGFKGVIDLPPLSRCIVPRSVNLEWTKLNEIPVPARIVGELHSFSPGATGYSTLHFDLKCKFFDADSKEYKKQNSEWDPVIAAIRRANTEEKANANSKSVDKSR